MLIVMERALVMIPNVIVYLDGIHLLIVRVSTASKLSGKNLISCTDQLLKCSTKFKSIIFQLSEYEYLLFTVIIYLAFVCFIDNDCNSHGICDDGTCNCDIDWDVKSDCSGNIQLLLLYSGSD